MGGVEATTFGAIEAEPNPTSSENLPAYFPSQDAEAVREIVGVSHFNPDRVLEMISARPALAKASWDWGFGDRESAIGAASHIGRDVAQTGTQVPEPERAAIIGVYAFGARKDQRLKVYVRKGNLVIKRGNAAPRNIFRIAPRVYHPTGAPAVRIRFENLGETSAAMIIVDADLMVQAARIPMSSPGSQLPTSASSYDRFPLLKETRSTR